MSEQFEEIFLRNATKMALKHALPEGCQGCAGARSAMANLVELAVERDQPVRESLEQFNRLFDGRCEGQIPVEETRECMPQMKCGHALGSAAVGLMWRGSA
jgi:hypothetical protein